MSNCSTPTLSVSLTESDQTSTKVDERKMDDVRIYLFVNSKIRCISHNVHIKDY